MMIKQVTSGLLSIIGGIIFAYVLNLVFVLDLGLTYTGIIVISTILLFLSCWGIAAFIIHIEWLMILISTLTLASFYLFFDFNYYYLAISIFILLIMILYAHPHIRFEEKSRIKINLGAILSVSLKSLILGLCLWVTATYYFAGGIKFDFQIPEEYGEKIIEYQTPGFSTQLTFDELVYLLMVNQTEIKKQNINQAIDEIKQTTTAEHFSAQKESIINEWNLNELDTDGNKSLKEIGLVNYIINNQIKKITNQYQNLTRWILIIAYFQVLYWLGQILYPISLGIIWLIYQLMLATKIIVIEKTKVDAEKIII